MDIFLGLQSQAGPVKQTTGDDPCASCHRLENASQDAVV